MPLNTLKPIKEAERENKLEQLPLGHKKGSEFITAGVMECMECDRC